MRNRISSVLYAALLVAASLAFTQSVLAQNSPAKFQQIQHVIVIYQENWSFDSLYGLFPGANGLFQSSNTSLTQLDRLTAQPYSSQVGQPFDLVSGSVSLTTPPQPINNNVKPNVVDNRFDPNLSTLLPYNIINHSTLQPTDKTGDIVHRYWHEQSQINHGKMNQFVSWSDNPGLVMSYFDATNLPEGKLAQQYTMCDNFFHAAYGGSFLNHQFLVAAAAPVYPNAPSSMQATLASEGNSHWIQRVDRLFMTATSRQSVDFHSLTAPPPTTRTTPSIPFSRRTSSRPRSS